MRARGGCAALPRQVGALTVAVVMLGACTGSGSARPGAVVDSDTAASIRAGDATVTIPAGAAKGEGRLVAARGPVPGGGLVVGVDVIGDGLEVSLTGTPLVRPAQVTFTVPPSVDGEASWPLVLWQDGRGGWASLPSRWRPGEGSITGDVEHFSNGFLARLDLRRWAADRAAAITGYVSGRSGVAQPSCGDEAAARAQGVDVRSDGGDTVKWCAGIDGGRTLLRVANNRRTFAQVTYPESWQVLDDERLSVSLDALNRTLTAGVMDLAGRSGTNVRLLSGGSILTFAVPSGGGHLQIEPSITAWALSGIQLGVDVYAWAASKVNPAVGEAAGRSWTRIFNRLVGAEPLDGYTEALRSCGRAFTDHVTDALGPANPADAAAVLKAAWGCVPDLMAADITESGPRLFLLGTVLAAIGGAVSALLSAINLVVSGTREVIDSFAALAGRSDPIYDIQVTNAATRPAPATTTTTRGAPPTATTPSTSPTAAGPRCDDRQPSPKTTRTYAAPPPLDLAPSRRYRAAIDTSCGTLVISLDAEGAPTAVNNFVFLARDGFYDGLTWHRAVRSFIIQGGDPKGDGTGGPGYLVRSETPPGGFPTGAVGAAKKYEDPRGSMGSQFFVVTGDGSTIPADHARFGVVIGGLDVARALESFATTSGGQPSRTLYIFRVTITEEP